ncbi:hypothetical protein Srubr_15800 [Streptomyces rubradiris]|uniref:Uncharacterized protein n=1 Tax=Streptomyces rubradiris TaxID=285531 RepID=A0ABQ3R7C6_STRRR|nr:hypothetical protein [Streptomyces rubradiris]GHH16829.1 hypothetical protein GCM10018792_47000 [Streptomyces rubradiris]GHI51734.1 hypothetical protein Srubr_15800 [Streptomyces rubradiris]
MTPTAQQSSTPAPSALAGTRTGAPAAATRRTPRSRSAGELPARTPTGTAHGTAVRGAGRARERASTAPGGRPCSV